MNEKIPEDTEKLNIEIDKNIKKITEKNFLDLTNNLKLRGGIPKESKLIALVDSKNGNLEHYFIKNKKGEIIKFADLRKNDLFLNVIKEYFKESYLEGLGKHMTDSEIEEHIDYLADIYLDEETNYSNQAEN